jgi:hypothetical protein
LILTQLLEKARRRLLTQLVLDKGALALVIGMSGAILLLLTGTQLLEWYWLVLLTVVSLGVGLYRLRGSIPSRYRVAQRIDKRLGLADALSTATHFSEHPEHARAAICEAQKRDAEEKAARVDVREAVPAQRSRYLLPAGGLLLVGFGLFAVRYAVTGSLSLEPSLLKIAYESFFPSATEQAKNQAKKVGLVPQPFNPGNPDAQSAENELTPDDPLQSEDAAKGQNPDSKDGSKEKADGKGDQKGDGGDKDGKEQGKEGNQQDGKNDKDAQQKEGNQDKGGKQGESSSMFDKIKDALSELAKKITPSGDNAKDSQSKQQSKQDDAGKKGDPSQQKSDDPGSQTSADSSQNGDKADSDEAKESNQQGKPSNQPGDTGAGKQDGDKAAKEAKMLEAMGKISEIIGKRSASVTGEVVVEVGSNKQQLKTAWSEQNANHTEAGGEIHRDEVPLMDQPYVQRYFEEVRKVPAASKGGKK